MDDNKPFTPDALKPDHRETLILNREFILTQDKMLVKGMPYMYSEGNHSIAVRLLEVWKEYEAEGEFVYLSLQELQTDRCFKVSWNLDYEGNYFLWSLSDLPSILNMSK